METTIIKKTITLVLIGLYLTSCTSKQTEDVPKEAPPIMQNSVELTPQQAKIVGVQTGKMESKDLSGAIKVNGMLDVPPQNLVSISAPMGGFVKSTELLQGMKVSKGQVIVVMQHPDYIQLQQDYLE